MIQEAQAGRNNSGANWRKRDVGRPVQGAVAVEEGAAGFPAAPSRP